MAAVPTYQDFMEPCLRVLAGAGIQHKNVITENVAALVGLTAEQRSVMLPSGREHTYMSRIWWSLSYLKQAGAVANPKRGYYHITDRGQFLLTSAARPINTKTLKQFEEFRNFLDRPSSSPIRGEAVQEGATADLSPDEQLSIAASTIRTQVKGQLLGRLQSVRPAVFERIAIDVLRAMGYAPGAEDFVRVGGGTGDDRMLGLDSIYVQAKRRTGPVGRPDVRAFVDALRGKKATQGVIISTSEFSTPAREYALSVSGCRVVLIGGDEFAGLMYDHGIGVSDAMTIMTRQLDSNYFPDETL